MHFIIMCLVSNERGENALDNKAYSFIKTCVAIKYLTDKPGFLFTGTHGIYITKILFLHVIFSSACSGTTVFLVS